MTCTAGGTAVDCGRWRRNRQLGALAHRPAPLPWGVPTGSSSKGFVVSRPADAMRYVGGGWNNPVTRASQSGGGGRIPRAGRLKQVWGSATRWRGSEEQAQSELVMRSRLGCALLKHSPKSRHEGEESMRVFELIFWSLVMGALLFGLFAPIGGY